MLPRRQSSSTEEESGGGGRDTKRLKRIHTGNTKTVKCEGERERERDLLLLLPINRLDRLTSGIVLFATTSDAARRYSALLSTKSDTNNTSGGGGENGVRKIYLARVSGEFPSQQPVVCTEPIVCINAKLCKYDTAPTATATATATAAGAGTGAVPQSQSACTHFKRLSYNGVSSLVQCEPITGRTHQIRVHLRWLRHPIVNDVQYAMDTTTRFVAYDASVSNAAPAPAPAPSTATLPVTAATAEEMSRRPVVNRGQSIWLHALSYTLNDRIRFETKPPEWAAPDFDCSLFAAARENSRND